MNINIVRLKSIANIVSTLEEEFVFVGGATISLYVENQALAEQVRPTEDIDVIVEVSTKGSYAVLEDKLRKIGFVNDVDSGIICRYKIKGIIVDIMPTDEEVLGFSNKWYPDGFSSAIETYLDENTAIKIFSLPYFIASKWEAYKGRGNGDYRTSKDFEDLVYLFENVKNIKDQLIAAPTEVKSYLNSEFKGVIGTEDFLEGVNAHIEQGYDGFGIQEVIEKIKSALGLE